METGGVRVSAQVAILPNSASVDAWERFATLARQVSECPRLAADRSHMEAMARAEREWKNAFHAWEARQ
jgi:hypothetical protein